MMEDMREDTVTVTYNGLDKQVDYRPDELVRHLLERAKKAFGVESMHLLSLFTESGAELSDTQTVQAAGVKPGMLLILRQSTVKGGR